jgi:hypothetical protein
MKGGVVKSDYLLVVAEVWVRTVLGRVHYDKSAAQQVGIHNFSLLGGVPTLRLCIIHVLIYKLL